MKLQAFFLNKFVNEESVSIKTDNRSFLYGDGLFETIIILNGKIRFWEYHWKRLLEGLEVLGIEISLLPECKEIIEELLSLNKLKDAKVKLQIWRASGGLYFPLYNEPEVLITMSSWENKPRPIIDLAEFSQKVFLFETTTSRFKTNSSLPYVLAANERNERKLDELILLDNNGNIAECTSSNIFWTDGQTYFTPSLSTGCVDGIIRKHVLATADAHNIAVNVGEYNRDNLLNAKSAFSCNVTGVASILKIEGNNLKPDDKLIPLLGL